MSCILFAKYDWSSWVDQPMYCFSFPVFLSPFSISSCLNFFSIAVKGRMTRQRIKESFQSVRAREHVGGEHGSGGQTRHWCWELTS